MDPKVSRREKYISEYVNDIETKTTIAIITKAKSWVFKKINNIYKSFGSHTKKKGKKTNKTD